MSGPQVITLGCRLNHAESAAMRALAAGEDDLVIVNSCAVTNEAVRQTRQAIRRAKRARPQARVMVTGCASQIDPAMFAAMPEVDRVIGNAEKTLPSSFQRKLESHFSSATEGAEMPAFAGMTDGPDIRVSDIMAVRETAPHLVSAFADRTRAFVEVQTGCDHRCTFCIIPYGRGNSRSVPAGRVIEGIQQLVAQGCAEVVLTGVDLTSYGPDLPGAPTLGQLIERILRHVPALQRLRLSSIDSIEIDDRLLDLITGEPRLMPHLHLSLQAGDDMVLKRMKRRHSRAQAIAIVERIKAKRDVIIGADLIAGFPTETEEMAINSLNIIDGCDIVYAHVFPYSPRAGTPAARMPQVRPEVARERAQRLREASAQRRAAWLKNLVGTKQRVLLERDGNGYSENYARVSPRSSRAKSRGAGTNAGVRPSTTLRTSEMGAVHELRIIARQGDLLIGEPV